MKSLVKGLIVRSQAELLSSPENSGIELETFQEEAKTAWDKAHEMRQNFQGQVDFVEPDMISKNVHPKFQESEEDDGPEMESSRTKEEECKPELEYVEEWAYPKIGNDPKPEIWHLGDEFSQLKSARDRVARALKERMAANKPKTVVRIAHLDTGYDPQHAVFPANMIRKDLQRNFTGRGNPQDAQDDGTGWHKGHGIGTLAILAGEPYPNEYNFTERLGLSEDHGIEIVPIRVARSVVLFKSNAFEDALEYVIQLYDDPGTRCHIITMSMGGAASRDWADLINKAYEKGIFIVTAAGNNQGALTPRTIVYPARFNRVVAACGATYDHSPYFKDEHFGKRKVMQGNYGPRRFAQTTMAAYTPNTPWAVMGCEHKVSLDGGGTSTATPQIASAAALYYQMYFEEIEAFQGAEAWKKVETIRTALFHSAQKEIEGLEDRELYYGQGILKASDMLNLKPSDLTIRPKEEKDSVRFGYLQILLGYFARESALEGMVEEMYNLEILQLISQSPRLQEMLDFEEKEVSDLSEDELKAFKETLSQLPEASQALKKYVRDT